MKLLSMRNQIREVASRWRLQYPPSNSDDYLLRRKHIQGALDALDVNSASDKEVEAIIGNDSWACPQKCDECGHKSYDIVELGKDQDYESATANICLACLRKAVILAEGLT